MPQTYTGIGLMTGTSLDGLDLACCRFAVEESRYSWELLQTQCVVMPAEWQDRLRNLPYASAETFARTHTEFGNWLGKQTAAFISENKLRPDFVASHGQTIFHQPENGFTSQIGDGESLVAHLPCLAVTNFRSKDVALGGQGAPLVPMGERFLFPEHRLFLNLGGICNLTYGDFAFDIAPCNLALNHLYRLAMPDSVTDYDPEGALAASGNLLPDLLAAWDALDWYQQLPPKSLGWEWISEVFLPVADRFEGSAVDKLHTALIHITGQIALAMQQQGIQNERLLVTGGGRRHRFFMEKLLQKVLPWGIEADLSAPESWVDFKEAIIFAFLGLRVLQGKSTSLATVTGAPFDVVGGAIHLPATGGWTLLG